MIAGTPKNPTVKFGGDYHTAQIYSMGYEFAFVSQKKPKGAFQQATCFVYCKDFLHDAIWAFLNKTKVSIYDFKYDSKKNPALLMNRTALVFRNTAFAKTAEKFHDTMPACLEFLHQADAKLGFQPTEIYKVEHKESPCWLLIADPGWQHSPTMISLFTLFIRLGCFHKPGATLAATLKSAEKGSISIGSGGDYAGSRDCKYVQKGRVGIDLILKHGLDIWHPAQKDNYPPELEGNGLHDNYGIVNFTAKTPQEVVPHWYRKEIWGKK